jgi:hypothetical protein
MATEYLYTVLLKPLDIQHLKVICQRKVLPDDYLQLLAETCYIVSARHPGEAISLVMSDSNAQKVIPKGFNPSILPRNFLPLIQQYRQQVDDLKKGRKRLILP